MFAFQVVNITIIMPEWFQIETNSSSDLINLGLGVDLSGLISQKKKILSVCVTFNLLLAIENISLFCQVIAQQETAKITRASAKVTDVECTDEEGLDLI